MANTISARALMTAKPFALAVTDADSGTALLTGAAYYPDARLSGILSVSVVDDGESVVLCAPGETASLATFPLDQMFWAKLDGDANWTMRTPMMTFSDFQGLRLKASASGTNVVCRFTLVPEYGGGA